MLTWVYIVIEVLAARRPHLPDPDAQREGRRAVRHVRRQRRVRPPRARRWWSGTWTASRSPWPSSSPSPRSRWISGCSDSAGAGAPGAWRWLVGTRRGARCSLASACGGSSRRQRDTTVTYVGVAGGAISFGIDQSADGLQPQHADGRHPGHPDRARRASCPARTSCQATGAPTPELDLIVSAELVSLKPETIVYTLNPKAVWSDGVPDHGGRLHLRLGAAARRPPSVVDRRDEHRRVPRHRVGDRVQRRPHGDGEVQEAVRRLADRSSTT